MPPPSSSDLFRNLRAATREAAGIPSYDPSVAASAAASFPATLRDAAAALDRSTPPYLRCERCRAKLFRGLQSSICAFCGTEPRREFPVSVSFTSTVAYRNLLRSLDVDGTELVTLNAGPKDPKKPKDGSGEEVLLSSLFEFELKWPREDKKVESSSASHASFQSTQPLNLSGVDLDNFFSEPKAADICGSNSQEEASSQAESLSIEGHLSVNSRELDDFDSLRLPKIETPAKTIVNFNSIDGWEASFQSARSVENPSVPISTDLFKITSSSCSPEMKIETDVDVTSQVQQVDITNSMEHESEMGFVSCNEEWGHDDVWQSAEVTIVSQIAEGDAGIYGHSMDGDLSQAEKTKVSVNAQNINDDNDTYDVWQDFTSSQVASTVPTNYLPGDDAKDTLPIVAVEKNLDTLDEMDFGDFLQSDYLSATMQVQSDFLNSKNHQFEAAEFNSWSLAEAERSFDSSTVHKENISAATAPQPDSAESSVQDLLSQMHDLSFMLENNLCLPNASTI